MIQSSTAASCGKVARKRVRGAARFLVAGALALWGSVAPAWAAPTVAQVLNFRPRQEGVSCTLIEADKHADCKVELVKGRAGTGSGWLLRDSEGKPVRLFFDTNDDNKIDVWSYFKDGVEVYREIDTNFQGKPDQFRWLNGGGMKWGVDADRDGKIDSWKAISPEEASQEILAALAAQDYTRLQALLITDAEIKELALPAEHAARVAESLKAAPARFKDTVKKLTTLSGKANWVHLETGTPQCLPSDRGGGRYDVVHHTRGTILFESGGKSDWAQTGEMILVGQAWKITGAPVPGATAMEDPGKKGGGMSISDNPKLAKLIEELTTEDKANAGSTETSAAVRHHLRRADILERVVAEVKPEERDPWIRQVADSLSTAAQSAPKEEKTAYNRLVSLEKQIEAAMPGSNLAAYISFREMQAEYAAKLAGKDADYNKVQAEWLERLGKFVSAYPKAEDAPDALLQCGMVSEFLNKEVEAKNWYGQLVKNFPEKPQAVKAAGAIRRLSMDGQALKLAGPSLADTNVVYDLDQASGKVVIVYYWASWNSQCVGDFAKLKLLMDTYSGKGVELVSLNLDNNVEDARTYLKRSPAPGVHMHQPGGLEGKLATDYGVLVLPSLFLVGKDGKVVSHNVQVGTLDEEIKKLMK